MLQVNQNDLSTVIIQYSRRDALRDRAIIRSKFHQYDGQASWLSNGETKVVEALSLANDSDVTNALTTALKTGLGDSLLQGGIANFVEKLKTNPGSKCLVVCANIIDAYRRQAQLKALGYQSAIATSDDSKAATEALKSFKNNPFSKVLVCVGMAYEGMNVPQITHLILLTNIRSVPYLEQCFARANRIDPSSTAGSWDDQFAHIFLPHDKLADSVIAEIMADQEAVALEIDAGSSSTGGGTCGTRSGVIPIASTVSGITTLNPDELPTLPLQDEVSILTPKQRADILKVEIKTLVSMWASQTTTSPEDLNRKIKRFFGKSRTIMTVGELEAVVIWVRSHSQE